MANDQPSTDKRDEEIEQLKLRLMRKAEHAAEWQARAEAAESSLRELVALSYKPDSWSGKWRAAWTKARLLVNDK